MKPILPAKTQALLLGKIARRQYKIKKLSLDQQLPHPAFLTGNDPEIKHLNHFQTRKGPTAFIATSGFRVLPMACKIADGNAIPPKIILIDHSLAVCQLWKQLIAFFETTHSEGMFEANFLKFLAKIKPLHVEPYKETMVFFKDLLSHHDFKKVRAIILNTIVVPQAWQHTETFLKIKRVLDFLDIQRIYVYPSNILSCTHSEYYQKIVKNIALLKPSLTILTDLSHYTGKPENSYLIEKFPPKNLSKYIFPINNTTLLRTKFLRENSTFILVGALVFVQVMSSLLKVNLPDRFKDVVGLLIILSGMKDLRNSIVSKKYGTGGSYILGDNGLFNKPIMVDRAENEVSCDLSFKR